MINFICIYIKFSFAIILLFNLLCQSFLLTLVEALLFRYMVCSKDMDSDSRSEWLKSKTDRFGLAKFVEHNSSMLGIKSNYKLPSKVQDHAFGIIKNGFTICPINALPHLEPEECEGISINQ